ncbi:MAG: quinoprotein dehydrogenase-associated putative ABC transporter substrate-binding protein, partial [Gemmatimonadaceae bacterium]
ARLIDAVARGDVDVGVAWGPLAGYFAKRESVPLDVTPVSPQIDLPFLPFVFDISMGVRRGNDVLRDQLNAIIERRRGEIDRILEDYGVPRIDIGRAGPAS